MKTIIATTDFSDASINAVLFAADLAMEVNGKIQIYHAVADRVVLIDNIDYAAEYSETEEAMQQLEALQEKIKKYTQYRMSIDAQLKYGNIDRVLEETCKEMLPFAVVLSATEKTAAERFWLGSETLSVSHKIKAPLLLIPHEVEFKGFKKIAVATDLSEMYETVPLNTLTRWIETFKAKLEFVCVKEDTDFEASNVAESV